MEYADGDRYEGEWKNEKKHGYGKYTYADGRIKEGMWFEGKEVLPEEHLMMMNQQQYKLNEVGTAKLGSGRG